MKKARFYTNISLYLRNDTRYGHSYYGMRIGNPTKAFAWYYFQWPWVTYSQTVNDTKHRAVSLRQLSFLFVRVSSVNAANAFKSRQVRCSLREQNNSRCHSIHCTHDYMCSRHKYVITRNLAIANRLHICIVWEVGTQVSHWRVRDHIYAARTNSRCATKTLVLTRHASNNNNNNNKHNNVYGAVIMAEPLREFTRFIWWM